MGSPMNDLQESQVCEITSLLNQNDVGYSDVRASTGDSGVLVELPHDDEANLLSGVVDDFLANGYVVSGVKSTITVGYDDRKVMDDVASAKQTATYVFIKELVVGR